MNNLLALERKKRRRNDPIDPLTFSARPVCYECMRPTGHCVCNLIEPFAAHCQIVILQHFHERKKYYGTAKLVTKGLTNCRIVRGIIFTLEQLALDADTYLLFPGKSAADCRSVILSAQTKVIVIDGTWDEAAKIIFNNPILKALPLLSFSTPLKSRYRIRKQPQPHFLSTIESIAHMLRINAPVSGADPGIYQRLLGGFDQMIEKQLSFVPTFPIES